MAKKTVETNFAKWLPLSAELNSARRADGTVCRCHPPAGRRNRTSSTARWATKTRPNRRPDVACHPTADQIAELGVVAAQKIDDEPTAARLALPRPSITLSTGSAT